MLDSHRMMLKGLRVALCHGRVPSDEERGGQIQRYLSLEQGRWSRGIEIRIRDLWREAHWITSVSASGEGQAHDGWVDNIAIGESS